MWQLKDRIGSEDVTYGHIIAGGGKISKLVMKDLPYPADAPVKMPWLAPDVLDRLLSEAKPISSGKQTGAGNVAANAEEGQAVFRTEVRVVALTVSVTDEAGAPIDGLGPTDFQVSEDGTSRRGIGRSGRSSIQPCVAVGPEWEC